MNNTRDPSSSAGEAVGALSPTVRTILSFLLVVHLFALSVVLLSRNPSLTSPLVERLRLPFVVGYLQILNLDPIGPYDHFALTQGSALDVDHWFEVDVTTDDGATEEVMLPNPQWGRQRQRPYRLLALNAAALVGGDGLEAEIPSGVAAGVMQQRGGASGDLRISRLLLQDMDAVRTRAITGGHEQDPRGEGYLRNIYEANLLVTNGAVSLVKSESGLESAPATTEPARDVTPQ